ncbi:hypothetical protein D3C83_175790 [compost metagenome]
MRSRAVAYERLLSLDIRRVYCYVRANNPLGLRPARKWHREIGRVWYVRVRGQRPVVIGAGRIARIEP